MGVIIRNGTMYGGGNSSTPTKERNMVFISDSYDIYSGWIAGCAGRLGLDSEHYHNIAQSGTGFYDGSFNTLLTNYRGTITSDYAETITHIIVCGGVNDSTEPTDEHLTTIYNNICDLGDYAKTNFPNAKVYLGYIGYALENSSVLGGRNYKNRMTMCGYWTSACLDRDNMYYLSNVEYALHHLDYMDNDGLHPNYKGGINIARYVANAIETGSADVKFLRESFNITGTNSTIEGEFNCYIDNEITHICMNNFSFYNPATWTMTHDDYLEFANIDSPYFQRFDPITIPAQIYENNKWVNIFVTMKCENSQLYFKSATVNDSGWKSLVGTTMGFESVSFCIPTLSC